MLRLYLYGNILYENFHKKSSGTGALIACYFNNSYPACFFKNTYFA